MMLLKVGGISHGLEVFGERSLVALVAKACEGKGEAERRIVGVHLPCMFEWAYVHVRSWNDEGGRKMVCDSSDTQLSRAMLLTWCAALFWRPLRRIRDVDVKHDFAFVVRILFPTFFGSYLSLL